MYMVFDYMQRKLLEKQLSNSKAISVKKSAVVKQQVKKFREDEKKKAEIRKLKAMVESEKDC